MLTSIGLNASFKTVPYIPKDLDENNYHLVIPEGFEDILEYKLNAISGSIELTVTTDESRDSNLITISQNLYNPSKNECHFPQFLIERNHKYPKIDYLTDTRDRFIFNQNEILYILLQNRLVQLKKHSDAFGNLISKDVKSLMEFITYIPVKAYNAIRREEASFIILSLYDKYDNYRYKTIYNEQCLGNILNADAYHPDFELLTKLVPNLPIQFSSESNGSKSKFTLASHDVPLYRSVGYHSFIDEKGRPACLSIFAPAQNNPARFKTHVTADALEVADFKPTSHFMQDYLPNKATKTYEPKDHCYKKAICVIHPILENNKFLFGEVYASPSFVETFVYTRETVEEQMDQILVEVGKTYFATKGKILVGKDLLGQDIYLKDCVSATLTHIQVIGTLGVQKLVFKGKRKAGNARLDSSTGLKGVTTCRPFLGSIHIKDRKDILEPSLVFGMNSFKAKGNGILLARAALAVELGYYKPKHFSGLLNTTDQVEIDAASDSLPDYTYYDDLGQEQTVQIGLVYARFTELGYVYRSYEYNKPFSFESGRVLHSLSDNSLFKEIWSKYISEDDKHMVLELEKILLDQRDIFEDKLPIYTPDQIIKQEILTKADQIMSIRTAIDSNSKLLDEEWNKGFFIDCTGSRFTKGKYIRIPSAKTLNNFCSQTNDKMYQYPSILINISKIIDCILQKKFHFLFPKNPTTSKKTCVQRYYQDVKGLIFTSEKESVMLVQKFSRPEVPGFAGKQVTDYILPSNTCVIMCDETYNRAIQDALGKDYAVYDLQYGFYGIHVRAPSLWRKQNIPVRIWSKEDFRIFLLATHNIQLEHYIHPTLNKDVVIFSNDVCEDSQSDVDGDHGTVYTPEGTVVQEALRNYNDEHVVQAEHDWINTYINGERSANDVLINEKGELVKHKYTLHKLTMHEYSRTFKEKIPGFSTYLLNAIEAKGNIGVSTNDSWVFNMILDLYVKYYDDNDRHYVPPNSKAKIPKQMYKLTVEQRDELSFAYIKALQDYVVRGVKHVNGGSQDFKVLFLRNIFKPENQKKVYELLTDGLKLPPNMASRMQFIVTWAETMGFRLACSAFLKLYNKGTEPTGDSAIALDLHEEYIQQNTYFGMLLEPIYALRQKAKVLEDERKAYLLSRHQTLETEQVLNPAFDLFD